MLGRGGLDAAGAVERLDQGGPSPVDGNDDRTHLAYELRLTNITAANLTIKRVGALDPSRRPPQWLDENSRGTEARLQDCCLRGRHPPK